MGGWVGGGCSLLDSFATDSNLVFSSDLAPRAMRVDEDRGGRYDRREVLKYRDIHDNHSIYHTYLCNNL